MKKLNILIKQLQAFTLHKNSAINTFKTMLAILIGAGIAGFFNLYAPWLIITILIVMGAQYRLGGAIRKGYTRLSATVIGGSLAIIILFFFLNNLILLYIVLFIVIIPFIYLASSSEEKANAYVLGAVTMVIILISNKPQYKSAFDRLFEILTGVLIALFVSRFIFPIRATKLLQINIEETLLRLKDVYILSIQEEKPFRIINKKTDLEEQIFKNFSVQSSLLKEATTESKDIKAKRFKYKMLSILERRLWRVIFMLHYTLKESRSKFDYIFNTQEFKMLHENVLSSLEILANKIHNKKVIFSTENLEQIYTTIVLKVRTILDQYPFEDKNKIHSFIFCLGRLITIIIQINRVISEL